MSTLTNKGDEIMAMPKDLVLVRHGFSDANRAQELRKLGRESEIPAEFYDRYDWQHPLQPKGMKQLERTRRWMLANAMDPAEFDRHYASMFIRARQSAGILYDDESKWYLDNRLVERDWGLYGSASAEERAKKFSHTERARVENPWFAAYDNGEALAGTVMLRARDVFDTLHREMARKRVLMVVHGEFMWCIRSLMEKMLPEEFKELDDTKTERIRNGSLLHYTHIVPGTQEEDYSRRWMRLIYPDAPDESPNGGQWKEVAMKRHFTGAELLGQAAVYPCLVPSED